MKSKFVIRVFISALIVSTAHAVPYKQIGKIEDDSYGNVRRVSARIVVAEGLSEAKVTEILTVAVKALATKYNANSSMVFAYRSKDKDIVKSTWTVGKAVYAPNGKWEDAEKDAEKKVVVQLGRIYFQSEKIDIPKTGSEITLTSKKENPIKISRLRDAWTSDQIIAQIPAGTSATILERYEKALSSDFIFVRYRIKTSYQGKEVEGWVFGNNILKKK